jgi:hypothetical protein
MNKHSSPGFKGFFLVIWYDWAALMSGIFAVPFTVGAIVSPWGSGQAIFAAMAIIALLITAYRAWADERNRVVALESHFAPRVRLEFDPTQPKFMSMTTAAPGFNILYVRVLARAMSPTVQNCRVFLKQVSQLNGERYVMLFDEPLPLPWSYENPLEVRPRQLNHDVDAFVDVAWFADVIELLAGGEAFSFLNFETPLPNRLITILKEKVLPFPERNLKLDILITGEDSESASLSLNIHRGQPRWDQPQVGWMKGDEIRRDSNV